MAARKFSLDGIGDITLYKRKNARSMRLSVASDGAIRLTLPAWTPYKLGLKFAVEKQDWIRANRRVVAPIFPSARIGKAHTLIYKQTAGKRPTVTVQNNLVTISLPSNMDYLHESAQAAAKRGSEKALLKEAEALLPERLATLADQKGFHFRSVRVRKLKGRWGSCNQNHDIVLNSYLMQLPWHLIDYVLLHELVHTRVMAHGKPFWAELGKYVKDLPTVRKVMRQQHPHLKPN